jgi:murein DD-endopeptidase MepM/ murein hydrolase activator NlpD
MKKSNIVTLILFTILFSSCAMRSGKYTMKNGKWVFVSQKTGFMHGFSNPRVDNGTFDYRNSGTFIWPVPSTKRISSYFGSRRGRHHDGIDIPAKSGTSIIASADGKVMHSGWMRGYGRVVIVKHPGGHHTVYAHNSKNIVKKGHKVSQGQVIAKVGSSGRSSGPHLHFEIRKKNKVSNPERYLAWVKKHRLARTRNHKK